MENKKLFKFIYWLIALVILALTISFIVIIKDDILIQKTIGLVLMLIVSFMAMVFAIIVSIYVYKDAKKRNMNEWMWMTIAVYIPNLLGLIIYLVMRNNIKKCCSNCGKQIEMEFLLCPYCGKKTDE